MLSDGGREGRVREIEEENMMGDYDESLMRELEQAVEKSKAVTEKLTRKKKMRGDDVCEEQENKVTRDLIESQNNPEFVPDEVEALKHHISQLINQVRCQEVELAQYRSTNGGDVLMGGDGTNYNQSKYHADLVAELYEASKRRDLAMLSRLNTSNQHRDEVLERLRVAEEKLEWYEKHHHSCRSPSATTDVPNGDIQLYVSKIVSAGDSEDIDRNALAAYHLQRQRSELRDVVKLEEMKSLLEDRDEARVKCSELEAKVIELESGADAAQGNASEEVEELKMRLASRDKELSDTRDELERVRVYYSLYGSLSQEAMLTEQYNTELSKAGSQLAEQAETVRRAEQDNNTMLGELRGAVEEKEEIGRRLVEAEAGKEQAEAECERLQRLVSVLRKKVNSMGLTS